MNNPTQFQHEVTRLPAQGPGGFMLRALAPGRSGSAAKSLADRYNAPSGVELHMAARIARARLQGEFIAAGLRAVADSVRRLVEQVKRRRQARMIYLALSKLDARTLCDIGLRRCEIRSFAAEASGVVEAGRS